MRWTHAMPVLLGALIMLTSFPALGQSNYPTSTSVTGTVVSVSGDQLVLKTSMGEETFNLASGVDKTGLTPGANVTVSYEAPATSGDRPMVNNVTMAAPGTPPSTTPSTTTNPSTTTPPATTSETTTKTEQLPATASPLPLIALIGLVALGAGLIVRRGARSAA